MPRLIDADALRRYLLDEYHGVISDSEIKIYQLIRLLNEQPTIDPERHGRWRIEETKDGIYWCCSECGVDALKDESGYRVVTSNWCPNCGSKMDGEARG
jgi:rubrerythrin